MSLPVSALRYGSKIEQVAIVECNDGESLYLSQYCCEDYRCWRIDPDLACRVLASRLYDAAAAKINRSLAHRVLVGASRYRTISGSELHEKQKIMLIVGQRGFLPTENKLLEVTYRLLFDKEDLGPRVYTIDSLALPRVVTVSTVSRTTLAEGV